MIVREPTVPPGVTEAQKLTGHVDKALAGGLARLSPESADELREVASSFAGSPLGDPLRGAVEKLAQGELLAHHMAVLAAARASLEGARADALLEEIADARGLVLERPTCEPVQAPSDVVRVRMESARQWLVEIALTGFEQLDPAAIVPVMGTLTGIQEHSELQGLAAMLTGLAAELLDYAPTAGIPDLPKRRWSDLWTACMLGATALPSRPTSRKVSGAWSPLGGDIRHHDHLVSLVIHGILQEKGGPVRLVRTTATAWKVDAIVEAEIWGLLLPIAQGAVDGLAKPMTLEIEGATLTSAGDLRWDGKVKGATPFDPFSAKLEGATLSAPPPRERHPMQIAVPAVLSGCKIAKDRVQSDTWGSLALDMSRVSPHSDLDAGEVAQSESIVGLLRYDDALSLQPLCGKKGKTVYGPAQGIAAAAKIKKAALETLKERASKLLREKA